MGENSSRTKVRVWNRGSFLETQKHTPSSPSSFHHIHIKTNTEVKLEMLKEVFEIRKERE